jgi:hypothetical protein
MRSAPVLRKLIVVSITICGMQNGVVNRVNYPQLSCVDCSEITHLTTLGDELTFGTVEQRFYRCGKVLRRPSPTAVSRYRAAAIGDCELLVLQRPISRRTTCMNIFILCILTEWFRRTKFVFLRDSD